MTSYTDADVQLVTAAINDASGYCYADDSALWAPYVLRALADAGRLAHDDFIRAFHAPLVAELRAFGIPTADTDPLEGVRLLIRRARDLEARVEADGTP